MKKIDVILVKKYVDAVSREIIRFGDFETIEVSADKVRSYFLSKTPTDGYTGRFTEYERRANFLMTSLQKYLPPAIETVKEIRDESEAMSEQEIDESLRTLEKELTAHHQNSENLKRRLSDIEIKVRKVNFFNSVDVDWVRIRDFRHFYVGFGIVPVTSYEGFHAAMSTLPSVIHYVDTIGSDALVFFSVSRQLKDKVDGILKSVYYRDYGIPEDSEIKGSKQLMKYAFDLAMAHDEEYYTERTFYRFAAVSVDKIRRILANIRYYLSVSRLKGEMAATGRVVLFSGWVPGKDVEKLRRTVESISENRCVFLEEDATDVMARDGLTPPTKLNNPVFLKPFESLVKTFGIPNYREIDPTLFAAIAYVILYGAMFGDAGHGMILALLGGVLLLIKKFKRIHNFAAVFVYIGISSMLFGLLYGTVFGLENFLKPIWKNPGEHIMDILMISVAFGAGMISVSIILSVVNSFLEKNWGRLILSANGISGLAFYWSLLFVGYHLLNGRPYPGWIWFVTLGTVLVIAFEKQLERLFFRKSGHHEGEKPSLVMGLVEVFEAAISLFSNTVSFMRVGAFALNHAALMSVVFILADSPNPVIRWIVIFFGNIFVIVVEGFIVGIQALRLEYYEFFVKFFRANGRTFEGMDIYKNG